MLILTFCHCYEMAFTAGGNFARALLTGDTLLETLLDTLLVRRVGPPRGLSLLPAIKLLRFSFSFCKWRGVVWVMVLVGDVTGVRKYWKMECEQMHGRGPV
jgi:hypothetical protein